MNRIVKIKIRDTIIRARAALESNLEHGVYDSTMVKRRIKELTDAIVVLEKVKED